MENENDENLVSQKDEIEALESIYGKDFNVEDEFCPTVSVVIRMTTDEKDDTALVVSFNSEYPSQAPPIFHISVPWMKRDDKQGLVNALNEVYSQHIGENIVYLWVEKLRELLLEIWNTPKKQKDNPSEDDLPETQSISPLVINNLPTLSNVLLPEIFTGEPLTDRKSTFQAHVAKIKQVEQVGLVLDELKKTKKIATATHNMYAFRVFHEENKSWQQDYDDDGETHAGGRLLHLLQILDCSNVVVVVTRWYGGIMLYGDRFKHINNVARQLLEKHGFFSSSTLNSKK